MLLLESFLLWLFFSGTFIIIYGIVYLFVHYFNFLSIPLISFFTSFQFLKISSFYLLSFLRHYLLHLFTLVFLLVLIFISETAAFFPNRSCDCQIIFGDFIIISLNFYACIIFLASFGLPS